MLPEQHIEFLEQRYERQELEKIFEEYNIKILDVDIEAA